MTWCGGEHRGSSHGCIAYTVSYGGEPGDGFAAMSGLWLQLHSYLPQGGTSRTQYDARCLRALPRQPLVLARRVGTPNCTMGFEPHTELVLLLRLVIAGILAAVLGWERESARKPAGLRTHMLVGIAAALYTLLAALAVEQFPGEPGGLRSDPIRVIQAVSIGIGFLGSGVPFDTRIPPSTLAFRKIR